MFRKESWWNLPWTLKLVDSGIAAILLVAPFLMGGRQAMGQLVLCVLATLTVFAWAIHQWRQGDARWKFTGVEPIMLLGIGLVLFQCCQLSPELLSAISPKVTRLLPEWERSNSLLSGVWRRISFTPAETRSNLIVIVACIMFFFVVVQRLTTVKDLCRFLRIVALGGGLMAAFGLAQYAWSNGKFFWVYEHPMTDTHLAAKGAFANANHFANFLAMAVPAQIFLIVRRLGRLPSRQERKQHCTTRWEKIRYSTDLCAYGWFVLLVITGIAILCSNSRPGIVATCLGVMTALTIFWHKSLLSTRQTITAVGLLLIWLSAIPLLTTSASGRSSDFHVSKTNLKKLTSNRDRRSLWRANTAGIRDFPLAGTGLGSHQEVYWLWFHCPLDGKEYSHAENGYLQIALETGLMGLGLVVLLWLTSLLWCAQGLWYAHSKQSAGVMAVVTAGLVVSLVQSVVDFVWYVPACVNVVLLYAACAWKVSLMRFFEPVAQFEKCRAASFSLARLSWVAVLPVVGLLGHWMIQEKLPEVAAEPIWDEYLRMSLHPESADSRSASFPPEVSKRRIELALAAAKANPRASRLQLHAGLACLKQFSLEHDAMSDRMPLAQIRDAARSLFTSSDEMNQWLNRAEVLGEQRAWLEAALDHFQASLQACPLQPRPYLELAELAWLRTNDRHAERHLVEQAVMARPCDARARFALGRLLWLNGEQKAAAAHWQFAFQQDAQYRGHLIDALAAYVPARFFLDYIEPDHESLKQLRVAYSKSDDPNSYHLILETLARSCVKVAMTLSGEQAEAEWILAHHCFAELGDRKGAYHSAREAVAANPNSYHARQLFGLWLYRNGHFAESIDQLSWCVDRHPKELWLKNITADARRKLNAPAEPVQVAEEPDKNVVR